MDQPLEQNKIPEAPDQLQDKLVKTYATDMAEAMGDNQGGMIKSIIREEEAKQKEHSNPELIKNRIFLGAGVLLIIAALVTLGYFYFSKKSIGTIQVENITPMIFTDKSEKVEIADLNKDQITKAIWDKAAGVDMKYGGVEELAVVKQDKMVGLREFIQAIKSPLVLSGRQFVDDNFLVGVYAWETKSPFILIRMRSIPDIFTSMHDWESKMFYDLHGIFGTEINADTNYLLTKDFEDGIVENKNSRILHTNEGNVALMYVFLDDTHLMIANDLQAVHEVVVRLAGSRIKQ
ncbi:MAG: hypothetical protein V4486_00060 [Patescibacteria group bacterium]